jgi:hypothetical protein
MRRRRAGVLLLVWAVAAAGLRGDAPPKRRLLGPNEREAVLALLKAVDLAQQTDVLADAGLAWENHVLKSGDQTAYVPFRLTIGGSADSLKSTAMYVRAVSRRDGLRVSEEHSMLRDWLARGGTDVAPRTSETVFLAPGEMPVGLGTGSSRQALAAAAAASAALAMQQRELEKQSRAADEAKKKQETRQRDPYLFPFEDYFFFDARSTHSVERALALPAGEYDVFVGLVDRDRVKTSSPMVLRRTVRIPDFWSDELALSSLILAKDVRQMKTAFAGQQQVEHPYAFGQAEVVPVAVASFTPEDALTVVFQICNYGAPDSDLTADYAFYRIDGARRLFNHTNPQSFSDADLPPPGTWETQAFASQTVALRSFPAGQYELEVSVRDRLTRATAKGTVAFTVASAVR